MDKIMLYILFLFHGFIFGGAEKDLTDCRKGSKYEACVCNDVPINPPYGSIELVDQTRGTYKCERGYTLKVNAIIRCLKGGKHWSNYWNASGSACAYIDDCNPFPCYNADMCIDGIEDYTCLCLSGYTGKNCSENITTMSETTSGHVTQHTSNDDSTEKQTTISRYTQTYTNTESKLSTLSYSSTVVYSSSETVTITYTTHAEAKSLSLIVPVTILVVLFVLAALALIVFLFRRKNKRNKDTTIVRDKASAHTITNKCYDVDRKISFTQGVDPQDRVYAEIQEDNTEAGDISANTYHTIDVLQDNDSKENNYGQLSNKTTLRMNDNYSHIGVTGINRNIINDFTYSHTCNIPLSEDDKQVVNSDDVSYNKLSSIARCTITDNVIDDIKDRETDYDHAHSASFRRIGEADTYSHLGSYNETSIR